MMSFFFQRLQISQALTAILLWLLAVAATFTTSAQKNTSRKPNIIVIYADDLGYGDPGCYGGSGVHTPHIDSLAASGLRFTDAHCGAATCTPSRFTLLTGLYAFRKNAAVLPGDAPLLITPGSETLQALLQKAGYQTAVVGKWHLGLGSGRPDWNRKIVPGANETGFNYSFIIPATPDRVPNVFVENDRVYHLDPSDPLFVSYTGPLDDAPTGLTHPEMLKLKADPSHSKTIVDSISRIGYMKGGHAAWWTDEKISTVLTDHARSFIEANKTKPFFLYFAIHDIHVPRAPNARFVGSTTMGRRGDAMTEMDWMTGQIMDQLRQLGLEKNTLVIFSSDNGPVLDDGYQDQAFQLLGNHDPAGGYRGNKYSAFEAGTRVPTIVYWPGIVRPGVSDALLSQVDLQASLAALAGVASRRKEITDSRNFLDAWLGRSKKGRTWLLEESYTLSLRKGDWKYIEPQNPNRGGWLKSIHIESGLQLQPQLYNLKTDPGERNNVAEKYPALVREMSATLAALRARPIPDTFK